MADADKIVTVGKDAGASATGSSKPVPKPANPAFRMLGIPQIRARLPSRNWLIFFTVVGSFTAAVTYDRRARKRAQQHWCNVVSPLSQQPLDTMGLPRRLTVYLAAPPGDGLRPSREFFLEYVKPVLVAGAVDWEVVEARREGDLRSKLAERIRRYRRKMGEAPMKEDEEDPIRDIRESQGIKPVDDRGGDLVIGRHAWKEYIRGLHEGWLGPVQEPVQEPIEQKEEDLQKQNTQEEFKELLLDTNHVKDLESLTDSNDGDSKSASDSDDASPTSPDNENDKSKEEKAKPAAPAGPNPALVFPDAYGSSPLAPSLPAVFAPTVVIAHPHILGFLNTPIRMYRFLTRRRLADATGAQVADLLMATEEQHFASASGEDSFGGDIMVPGSSEASTTTASSSYEQSQLLAHEEADWHQKTVRKPRPEGVEAVWSNEIILDPRIAGRMRTPSLLSNGSEFHGTFDSADDTAQLSNSAAPAALKNAPDWKGGADRGRVMGWWEWFVYASGFADEREPRGEYAGQGLIGDPDE